MCVCVCACRRRASACRHKLPRDARACVWYARAREYNAAVGYARAPHTMFGQAAAASSSSVGVPLLHSMHQFCCDVDVLLSERGLTYGTHDALFRPRDGAIYAACVEPIEWRANEGLIALGLASAWNDRRAPDAAEMQQCANVIARHVNNDVVNQQAAAPPRCWLCDAHQETWWWRRQPGNGTKLAAAAAFNCADDDHKMQCRHKMRRLVARCDDPSSPSPL